MLRTYAGLIVQYRTSVLVLPLLITVLLGLQLRNLDVIIDADELLLRDHPYVQVTERMQAAFRQCPAQHSLSAFVKMRKT